MTNTYISHRFVSRAALLFCSLVSCAAEAQVIITNASIAAGSITPGDAPGFPATLSVSGAYKLGENIKVSSSKAVAKVIDIAADDITLDLNGFSIIGSNTCLPSSSVNTCVSMTPLDETFISVGGYRALVKNGNVIGSRGVGVAIDGSNVRLENLTVSQNRSYGIGVTAAVSGVAAIRNGTILSGIISAYNGGEGIWGPGLGEGDIVINASSVVANNGGVSLYSGSLTDVLISHNGAHGVVGGRGILTRVAANHNAGNGISDGSTVIGAIAYKNGTGFRANGLGTVYVADTASFNQVGFQLAANGCYSNIASADNTTSDLIGGTALNAAHVTCP